MGGPAAGLRRGLGSELGHGSYGRVNLGTKGIPGRDDCKDALAIETLRDEKADVSKGHRADAEFAADLEVSQRAPRICCDSRSARRYCRVLSESTGAS